MPNMRGSKVWPAGRVLQLEHSSTCLQGNPWEDPCDRLLSIYLPAAYDEQAEPYIALWDLAAFTNSGLGHVGWRNHGENLQERLDRLIGQGLMPPVVVIMPDCYTSLGGNQYVNSPAVGCYADYLVEELVPFVSRQLNVIDHPKGRGIFGKSSGGFGALFHAMHYPETWGAMASHAGDAGFDLLFRPAFPDTCLNLSRYNGDIHQFIASFWKSKKPSGRDFTTLMVLAMAATYDPDSMHPENIRLPFDLQTCTLNPERWQHWLAYDPINLVPVYVEALRKSHGLYIDVGNSDQYNIQFGTRKLVGLMQSLDIACAFEEFEGSHSGIDWRLDHSLPFLAKALKSAQDAAN
jgi:S-formylglutathione hydrolase FrmB